ncbi:hypothetical protein [Desulfoluna sp.]|uniref:hypothetical protein n=1 Tax=Desulfoluna sp. TaxID=2045199 RepID=UPI002634A496|nr:hypothetical protein [Desulfoluna sp.]
MKIALFLCVIVAVLFFLITAYSKRQPKGTPGLNDDGMMLLDAEELGEGHIGSSYENDVIPLLTKYISHPTEIDENFDSETGSYKVSSQNKTYVIYSPEMDLSEGHPWGNATFALFDIVNRQLQDSPYRFYAINGGNDLCGIFLTYEARTQAIESLEQKTDWPYLPEDNPPWYGQPHDESPN